MKRSNFKSRYVVALLFGALLIQFGCKKEDTYSRAVDISMEVNMNTYDYLKSKPGVYDSLLYVIDRMGLAETLKSGEVTLFAPSNESFRIAIRNLNDVRKAQSKPAMFLGTIAAGATDDMLPRERPKARSDKEHLDSMINMYIIPGLFTAANFSLGDGLPLTSNKVDYPMHGKRVFADAQGWQGGGSEVIEFSNTKRSVFVPHWAKTTTTSVNIKTTNGIVHLLEPDHVFGFDEFVTRLTLIPPPTNLFLDPRGGKTNLFIDWQDNGSFDGSVNPGEKFIWSYDGNYLTKMVASFSQANNKVYFLWSPVDPLKVVDGNPLIANSYTITSANDSKTYQDRDPKAWVVEGTNDQPNLNDLKDNTNINWVILDTRQDQEFTTNYQRKIYDFENTVPYKHYRITFLQTFSAGSMLQLSEWTFNYREKL
ncbi:fasciclin domain-containing protein [Pedobacter deserti]|uniref:fasciclin domain-containing protein n=1 Tax=Pedobacter deserti TaxID=2817382 RepID=UPI0021097C69|nr:fasciclin domain-containing protein [Pedobacter sp. SYSU D00382]